MRTLTGALLLVVLTAAGSYAAGPVTLQRAAERIDLLERRVEELEQKVRLLSDGASRRDTRPGERLIGTWSCTNSLQTYAMTFLPNGRMFSEEATLGTMHQGSWSRIGPDRISINDGAVFDVSYTNADEFEIVNPNFRTTGTCRRLQ